MAALKLFGKKGYGKATELAMSILDKSINLRSYKNTEFDHLVRPEYILNATARKHNKNCVLNDGDDLYYVNLLEPKTEENRNSYLVHQSNFEELFKGILKFYFGGDSKVLNLKVRDKELPMDVNGRFRKQQYLQLIEDGVQRIMPENIVNEFYSIYIKPETCKHLETLFEAKNIPLPENRTIPNLLRELANIYVYPGCLKPTYIEHIPKFLIPLTKETTDEFDLVEVAFCGRKIGMIRPLISNFYTDKYRNDFNYDSFVDSDSDSEDHVESRYDLIDEKDEIMVKYLDFMNNFPHDYHNDCVDGAMTNLNAGLMYHVSVQLLFRLACTSFDMARNLAKTTFSSKQYNDIVRECFQGFYAEVIESEFDFLKRPEYILNIVSMKYNSWNDQYGFYKFDGKKMFLATQEIYNNNEIYAMRLKLGGIVERLTGSKIMTIKSKDSKSGEFVVDFGNIYRKIDFLYTIEDEMNVLIPEPHIYEMKGAYKLLEEIFAAKNIILPERRSVNSLLKELARIYLYPLCDTPTHVEGMPICMASNGQHQFHSKSYISELAELVIDGQIIFKGQGLTYANLSKKYYEGEERDEILDNYLDFLSQSDLRFKTFNKWTRNRYPPDSYSFSACFNAAAFFDLIKQ